MAKNEWMDWLKCNVLEIVILILVLVLLVKVFSVPAVEKVSIITGATTIAEPLAKEAIPESPVKNATAETPVEKAEEPPLEKGVVTSEEEILKNNQSNY